MKKTTRWIKNAGLFAAIVMLLWAIPQMAMAAGTASGTNIDNLATVDYQVGGVDQDPIESAPTGNSTPGVGNGTETTFVVDTSLDMSVASQDAAAITGTPGEDDYVLTFEVTNDGNDTQDFSLTAVPRVGGTLHTVTDTINVSNVEIYVESGDAAGYDALDVATYIDELAADDSIIVYIVSDFPLSAVNGDGAIYDLVAQVAVGGTAAAQGADITTDDSADIDDPTAIQVVFTDAAGTASGDTAYDGTASDDGVYEITSAALEVTKESDVYSDPVNGTTNPKAIPGAYVEYTITVDNASGSSAATSVTITDSIPANTEFVVGSVTGGDSVDYSDGSWGYTPAGTTDPAVIAVRIVFNSIAAGGSASATFQVMVQD